VRLIGPARRKFPAAVEGLRGPRPEWSRGRHATPAAGRRSGEYMAVTNTAAPTREDFAAMLDESFSSGNLQEGSVIKGTVVGIEKHVAIIDVGLKTEGRVALREFSGPGRHSELKMGDTVEV